MSDFLSHTLQKEITTNEKRAFLACVRMKSQKNAADALGVNRSTVSTQLTSLDRKLKMQLFKPNTSGYVLTKEGEILHEILNREFAELGVANRAMEAAHEFRKLKDLHVYTSIPLGIYYLPEIIAEFSEAFPDVHVKLVASPSLPDPLVDTVDILIFPGQFKAPYYVSTPFFKMNSYLYASPAYLEKHGRPKRIQDLANHKMINAGPILGAVYTPNWFEKMLENAGVQLQYGAEANSSMAAINMAIAGGGITSYAKEMVDNLGLNVEAVLPHDLHSELSTYLSIPKSHEKNGTVGHFIEVARRYFAQLTSEKQK